MFNYTREILKSLHLFPSHYLLPQTTKIDVINLGIRCAPTPGHHTPYQQSRSGKKVFAKLSNKAKSIVTKISLQRCIVPKQLMPNFNNLQIVPIENIVQSSTVYTLRIKYHLPIWMSNSKINLPRSKMTCPDFCLNHLT